MNKLEQINADLQFDIAKHIVTSASKCRWDYACLTNSNLKNHKICDVESSSGYNVLFIDHKQEKLNCKYRIRFGHSSYLCTCPVRREIYKKYKC